MSENTVPELAAKWALDKVGCAYSQPKRTQANIFDCSSLVARAYSAQGKRWKYGGSVPCSYQEVYDDEFELLWPDSYDQIGKKLGGDKPLRLADQPGDLQFLQTDPDTTRSNRITHVAMVAGSGRIVHARGTAYGVCVNASSLYSGKVCAVTRYNPVCVLRSGMKGYRTLSLQRALASRGESLSADGEYGAETTRAVRAFQRAAGLDETGQAGADTLSALQLTQIAPEEDFTQERIEVTGDTVNIRLGPGAGYASVGIARKGDVFTAVGADGWQLILVDGQLSYISKKYIQKCV